MDSHQTALMPRQPRDRTEKADAAYDHLIEVMGQLDDLEVERQRIRTMRAEAVVACFEEGWTLRALAEKIGSTPESVRQLSLVTATPAKSRRK